MPKIRTGFVEVNRARLYYERAGTGPAVALLHGGLVNCQMWDDQFARLARRYTVVRFDQRGMGQSTSANGEFAAYEDVRDLLLALGIGRAALIGLSFGGAVAIECALAYPALVQALVLVSSGLTGFAWSQASQAADQRIEAALERGDNPGAAEAFLRIWTDGPYRQPADVNPQVRAKVQALALANLSHPPEYATMRHLQPPAATRLREINTPTLVITGDKDTPDILTIAGTLSQQIPGAQHASIPNAAHMVNMEQPKQFNRIVLDFLSKVM